MIQHYRLLCLSLAAFALGSGCQTTSRSSCPTPPALPHGHVHDVVVSVHASDTTEVAEHLAAAVQSLTDHAHCATVRMTTSSGFVVALATLAAAPADDVLAASRHEDVRNLLASCLRSVPPWARPVILVSVDAESKVVLAGAAFTQFEGDRFPQVHQRPLNFGGGTPVAFLNVSGVDDQDADWLMRKAFVLFYHQARAAATAALEARGK